MQALAKKILPLKWQGEDNFVPFYPILFVHTPQFLSEVRVCKLSSLDEEIEKQSLKKGAYRARKAGATALATSTIEPGQHSRGPHYFQNTQMTKI